MAAIGYVTVGAIDSNKSGAFYDAVFTAIGSERKLENGDWLGYGAKGWWQDLYGLPHRCVPAF